MHNLIVHRGDDDHFLLTLTDNDNKPLNLQGAVIAMSIKHKDKKSGKTIVSHIPQEQLKIIGTGQIALMLSHTTTSTFDFRTAQFDLRIKQHGLIDTVMSGTLQVQDTITPMTNDNPSDQFTPKQVMVASSPAKIIHTSDVDDTDYLALLTLSMQ